MSMVDGERAAEADPGPGPGGERSGIPVIRRIVQLVVFGALLVLLYVEFVQRPEGQQLDSGSFALFGPLNASFGLVSNVARNAVPFALGVIGAGLGVWSLTRRRYADALRAAAIVAGSVILAEGLKIVLPRPDYGIGGYADNTFPSGHTAVSIALVVAVAVLLPSRRARWGRVLVGSLLAVGVAWVSVVSFAHRPADTIAAASVVAIVATTVLWTGRLVADTAPGAVLGIVAVLAGAASLLALVTGAAPLELGLPLWLLALAGSSAAIMVLVPIAPARLGS